MSAKASHRGAAALLSHNIPCFHDKFASSLGRICAACYQKDNKPMKVFRGLQHAGLAPASAVTIGNFDGIHRGHQAMLALLKGEAQQRGVPSCVLTFEPHPRDYFAAASKRPELAPARIGTLRDKLGELAAAGVAQTVVLPFDARLASQA